MKSVAYAWTIALLSLAACGGEFPPGARVTKLRLLAVRADAPFAQPEQSVALEPLLAEPEPEAQSLRWAYATCTDPADSSAEGCLSELDQPFTPFDPAEAALSVQVGELGQYTRSGVLGVAIVACPGTIESGATGSVPVRCRDQDELLPLERFEVGVKRIFVRERDQNQNPSIETLTWDGEAWPEDEIKEADACTQKTDDIADCPAALRHRIGMQTSPPESGISERGVPFQEQQVVQFYATQGVFDSEVRLSDAADNRWAAQRLDGQDLATLWFVVRDDRGGVGWGSRQVRVH